MSYQRRLVSSVGQKLGLDASLRWHDNMEKLVINHEASAGMTILVVSQLRTLLNSGRNGGKQMDFKKVALATIGVAVVWFVMDYVIHSMILMNMYQETMHLWRPMAEINHVYCVLALLIYALLFVLFYAYMIKPKDCHQGLKFGCWYGLLSGFGMAMSYLYMPIPGALACGWFFGAWAEGIAGGAVLGWLMKDA